MNNQGAIRWFTENKDTATANHARKEGTDGGAGQLRPLYPLWSIRRERLARANSMGTAKENCLAPEHRTHTHAHSVMDICKHSKKNCQFSLSI